MCREFVLSLKEDRPHARIRDEGGLESGRVCAETQANVDRLRAALAEIFRAVSKGLQDERESAKRCMQRAAAILRIDPWFANAIEDVDFPCEERSKLIRGGLASWQVQRVMTHIEANLDAKIRNKDLAAITKLSSSHFSRAFRESFHESPHGYVMRRRVERAQGLMLTTDASLVRIATDCGLADQAHFVKVFRRFVGESPGAWRRERASVASDRR